MNMTPTPVLEHVTSAGVTHSFPRDGMVATSRRVYLTAPLDINRAGTRVLTIAGAGGTVTAVAGETALAVIDSGFGARTLDIIAAIRKFDPRAPSWLVNTHWHFDHTDGNQRLRDAGATLVAHQNCRSRMEGKQSVVQLSWEIGAAPRKALQDVTINDEAVIDLGASRLHLLHQAHAHTDGDLAVMLPDEDVLVAGDLFTNGSYPVIDLSTGGSLAGMIEALKHLELLAGKKTVIVPGHGRLAKTDDLLRFIDMLRAVETSISHLQAKGMSKKEIISAKPTAALDEIWGTGYVTGERFLDMVLP
jgi:glyoxylase-like metal-dependent hydrolase (beta-lactamase superfamily II)